MITRWWWLNKLCYIWLISFPTPRLTFPTVTGTTSPLSILPQFVETLGKKLDKIRTEMDRGVETMDCHIPYYPHQTHRTSDERRKMCYLKGFYNFVSSVFGIWDEQLLDPIMGPAFLREFYTLGWYWQERLQAVNSSASHAHFGWNSFPKAKRRYNMGYFLFASRLCTNDLLTSFFLDQIQIILCLKECIQLENVYTEGLLCHVTPSGWQPKWRQSCRKWRPSMRNWPCSFQRPLWSLMKWTGNLASPMRAVMSRIDMLSSKSGLLV